VNPLPKPAGTSTETKTSTSLAARRAVESGTSLAREGKGPETLLRDINLLDEEVTTPRLRFTLARSLRTSAGLFLIYLLTFHTPVVRGSSMQPGLQDGDRILVEPWSELVGYNRGDIVVMRYPLDTRVDYVKRIIGLPGDRIVLGDGGLWVNGVLLTEPYVGSVDRTAFVATTVRPDHFFVLGDNRLRSSDSREFGQVKADLLRGRVGLRMWPLSRLGFLN
jgi:signal peptidase I